MSTRSKRGQAIEPITNIPSELSDAPPIKKPRISKVVATIPGAEYVSNPNLPACESDSNGLKGQTFLNFVYNQLKTGSSEGVTSPKVYIMMGPPGAGKSTIKKTFAILGPSFVIVNVDIILTFSLFSDLVHL